MAINHGVYTREVSTGILSPVEADAGLPVVVGTAPVFMTEDAQNVNKPKLIYNYAEAVENFGYSSDWENFTLCEFIYSQFALYNIGPCVLINVLDPSSKTTTVALKDYSISNKKINLGSGVVISRGLTFESGKNYKSGTDYVLNYNSDGEAIVNILNSGAMASLNTVKIGFSRCIGSSITKNEIIGGVDSGTGQYKGLELVNKIFPLFRLVPGLLLAPGWSKNSEVAAIMAAKMENINGLFSGLAICDIDSDSCSKYSDCVSWKNNNNFVDARQIICWPKLKLDDKIFNFSTQLAGLINTTDYSNDNVPYESPSNKNLNIDGCVNDNGDEINLGIETANYLNSNGIMTALNWVGGWRAWGNRMAVYPDNSDVKDMFIPVRRMFDFIRNNFILTFWQKLDAPVTPRLIRTIVNSYNVYLNGLSAREFLLGGRIEFQEGENPTTDLLNGILKFHVYITPPVPAEEISGTFEFDTSYLSTLFGGDTNE